MIAGDEAAVLAGTPTRLAGCQQVATMFDGAAKAALPVFIGDRPGAVWFIVHAMKARDKFLR